MFNTSKLKSVRKQHATLQALPDTIHIPAIGRREEVASKPVDDATLDDLAFAVRGVEVEFNELGDRLYAIRKLYSLARQSDALGADRALDAITSNAGGR